jgi:acetyl esterase/lipase
MRDEAFSALQGAARRRMLEIGPRWAEDIVGNRNLVIRAYTPVLAQAPREGIDVVRDAPYGEHPRQRLDIYKQPGLAKAPVVLFVHGGAFIRGEKDSNPEIYGNVTRYFARHGCIGVNMEYRLAPDAPYPAGAQDVGLAVAWLRERAQEHGGDPERIVLVGHSAGAAHAGAYVCDPAARPASGHGVAALALISGRVRADARPDNPNANAVRAYYGADESLYEARSVVTYAAGIDVPLFLAVAEYENPYLDAYMAELASRVGALRKRMPRFIQLPGHNHTSIVAHFDSGEDRLGRELLRFAKQPA